MLAKIEYSKGDKVHILGTIIVGKVVGKHYHESTDSFEYSVEWTEGTNRHVRRFATDQLTIDNS